MASFGAGILMLALLAAYIFMAMEFGKIAAMKGHPSERYMLWTLLLPPFGMLMGVALPDRAKQPGAAPRANDVLPPL